MFSIMKKVLGVVESILGDVVGIWDGVWIDLDDFWFYSSFFVYLCIGCDSWLLNNDLWGVVIFVRYCCD